MTLPCVIDIEASGFGRGSYPIEIGFVLPDGKAVCTLIRPLDGWTHWDGEAASLHGLSRELLLRHGRPAAEVAALLNRHLAGCSVYSDNWAHDFAWLALLFDGADTQPAFRLRHLRELLDDDQAAHWDGACAAARHRLPMARHRASNDARIVQQAIGALQSPAWTPAMGAAGRPAGAA